MSDLVLETKSLTKVYDLGKGAIDIDLEVRKGEIVGFIGPNGAGKTTTIRMIMGLITPNSGSIELFGSCVHSEEDLVPLLRDVGFMPSDPLFYPDFTPSQVFKYACGIAGSNNFGRAVELSNLLDLDINRKFKFLSQGNKTKVGVVNALLHEPKLLILDEPTSGLDPLIQQKVLRQLLERKKDGGSVFLSSHVLSEVEQVTDRLYMINQANITLEDKTKNIVEKALKRFVLNSPPKALIEEFESLDTVKKIKQLDSKTIFYAEDTEPILKRLGEEEIYDFFLERTSLEEMFLDKYEVDND